ncbi:PREDICTED: mechanosensitive ion channel protein 10 isoform X2 [Nelumbo nucifera]|uniref:Mechanosensitive ion channel protein n=1 Tax=Nelumbo nucifera TaxID=4432 RepID=A0A1U8Q964_NELNU|nr:PREDICTED: mechanosensitive ion channel protein 10 isoform X2 [Nelumbo nucifera]
MDVNGKATLNTDKTVAKRNANDGVEVVVMISGEGEASEANREAKTRISKDAGACYSYLKDSEALARKNTSLGSPASNAGPSELDGLKSEMQLSTLMSCPYPDMPEVVPSANKPPKISTEGLVQRKSMSRSVFSKPKSRFVDLSGPTTVNLVEENTLPNQASKPPYLSSPKRASPTNSITSTTPRENLRTAPVTPKTPLMASPGRIGEDDDDEDIYKNVPVEKKPRKKLKIRLLIEWIPFICLMSFLVASLTVHKLENTMIWGLGIWKWCVLVMVIFCGRLVTEWFINVLVFLIEKNFLLRKKVLYFVYGLKKSVQVCIWLGLVLLTWALLINRGVKRSAHTTKILNYVSRALASSLIGAVIWMIKTLLLKILASSFHVTTFFDRIQESIFHQYVLQILSGPPLMELAERVGSSDSTGQLNFRNAKKGKEGEGQEVIDVVKLQKMKQEKVSAWTMRGLIDVIRTSGLSTISNTLDESIDDEGGQQKDKEITSEWEAKVAAYQIFRNVAKPGSKYIEEEDLQRFLKKEEVGNVLQLFEGAAETRKIKKSALRNWVVKVYLERKSLAHSLNDTNTALFLVVFMFGNTCKTVFEAIIFVFVMHPFDVGDRCVIDGVQMIVEEMNILTTVFLRYDNEKIYYPNSVLATKPISNFYRSPEMSDSVEFSVDFSTSVESLGALKTRIKAYIDNKPQHWHPNHSVVVKEIEDVNKMKMALYVLHTMNHQNYGEKTKRRSELVVELKKIFEELDIKYHLLPQEVHLNYIGSSTTPAAIGR